jgi:hypothetical protein
VQKESSLNAMLSLFDLDAVGLQADNAPHENPAQVPGMRTAVPVMRSRASPLCEVRQGRGQDLSAGAGFQGSRRAGGAEGD